MKDIYKKYTQHDAKELSNFKTWADKIVLNANDCIYYPGVIESMMDMLNETQRTGVITFNSYVMQGKHYYYEDEGSYTTRISAATGKLMV